MSTRNRGNRTKGKKRRNPGGRPKRRQDPQAEVRTLGTLLPEKMTLTLKGTFFTQQIPVGNQGGAIQLIINSLAHAIPGGTFWVIAGETKLLALYSAGRIMTARVKHTINPLDTVFTDFRSVISNQSLGTTFTNYQGMENNQYGKLVALGVAGSPTKKVTTYVKMRQIAGGKFQKYDDAYITTPSVDPTDQIFYGFSIQTGAALVYTATKGVSHNVQVAWKIELFGRQAQTN